MQTNEDLRTPTAMPSGARRKRTDQRREGGPRAGSGAAVAAAMRAAGTGCTAWASGLVGSGGWAGDGGGAPLACAHKGQSMPVAPISTAPSSVCTSHLMAPEPEQTTSSDCGCTSGDATDTPMEPTNHASTHRRTRRQMDKVRGMDMMGIMPGDGCAILRWRSDVAGCGAYRASSSRTAATCLRDTESTSVEPCRRTAQPSPSSGS